jgi:hypothetical protein
MYVVCDCASSITSEVLPSFGIVFNPFKFSFQNQHSEWESTILEIHKYKQLKQNASVNI